MLPRDQRVRSFSPAIARPDRFTSATTPARLRSRIALQHDHDQTILVADLQALTDNSGRAAAVHRNFSEIVLDYLDEGIDPDATTIALQSAIRAFDPDAAAVAALEDRHRHGGLGDVVVKHRLENCSRPSLRRFANVAPSWRVNRGWREPCSCAARLARATPPRSCWPVYVQHSRSSRCEERTTTRSSAIMCTVQHRASGTGERRADRAPE